MIEQVVIAETEAEVQRGDGEIITTGITTEMTITEEALGITIDTDEMIEDTGQDHLMNTAKEDQDLLKEIESWQLVIEMNC